MLGFPFATPINVFGVNPMRRACRARAYAPVLHSRMILQTPPSMAAAGGNPVDVTETEGAFVISVDVPGVEPSAIKVNLSDGVLTIRGERKTAAGHKAFQRAFALPRNVDADAVEAHLANGVLEVTLPKAPKPEPTNIPVTVRDPEDATTTPAADHHHHHHHDEATRAHAEGAEAAAAEAAPEGAAAVAEAPVEAKAVAEGAAPEAAADGEWTNVEQEGAAATAAPKQ